MFSKRLDLILKTCHQTSLLRLSTTGATNYQASHIWTRNSDLKLEPHSKTKTKYSTTCSSHRFMSRYSSKPKELHSSKDEEHGLYNLRQEVPYESTENGYLYSIIKKTNVNSDTTLPEFEADYESGSIDCNIEKNLISTIGPTELLKTFRAISHQARIKSEKLSGKHDRILDLLIHRHNVFTHHELWDLLRSIEMWYPMQKKTKHRGLMKLEKCLDEECLKRMDDWTVDEILKTCDFWYHLRQIRTSDFVFKAMNKLGNKPKRMSPQNYLQFMFLINVARRPSFNMYELEYRLESIIKEFSAEELAVIALGFFKSETPIRNPALLNHMIQMTIDNLDSIGDIAICATMKITRHSLGMKDIEVFRKLLTAFESKIKTASPVCLVHAAHAAASTMIFEKEIIDKILNKFIGYVAGARLKDLERILFAMMVFNYSSEHPLLQAIIDQLHNPARKEERDRFPKTFSTSLMFLSSAGIYPQGLIKEIMQHNYLREIYNNNSFWIGREYLYIESGLKIEVPEYQGPFLPDRIYSYLSKKYSSAIIKVTNDASVQVHSYQKFIFEIAHYVKKIVGADNMRVDQILPHHQRSDIIVRLDKKNNFVPIGDEFSEFAVGVIKYPPKDDNHRWFVLVLASNNHIFRRSEELAGTINSKMRQLIKIGYTPVPIRITDWKPLVSNSSKQNYLGNILSECKLINKTEITE